MSKITMILFNKYQKEELEKATSDTSVQLEAENSRSNCKNKS